MSQGVSTCIQLLFDFRPAYTGIEGCQVGSLIQRQQAVEMGKVHGQDRGRTGHWIDVANHTRPPP